jgi:hypothetical protein
MDDQPRYNWKELSASVVVEPGPKQYGKVKLPSGREIIRNYARELKNGKGLSFCDLMVEKIRQRARELRDNSPLY